MIFIPIKKDHVPYSAQYRIAGKTFTFNFRYNSYGDYFTIDLSSDAGVLVNGEKVVYGKALFSSYRADDRLPQQAIIPVDLSMNADRAGWEDDFYLFMPSADDLEVMQSV